MTHAPRIERRGSGAGGKHKKPWPASIPQASLSRAALLHCRGPGVVAYPSGVALLHGDASIDKVELSPLRTFPEVEVVPSTFMVRVKRKGNEGQVRLVEMQRLQWEYQQKQAVANYLRNLLPEVTILV